VTHRSLFDGTNQGVARTDVPAFSFQGHPEASPARPMSAAVRPLRGADGAGQGVIGTPPAPVASRWTVNPASLLPRRGAADQDS
jgi:hypothetical protein